MIYFFFKPLLGEIDLIWLILLKWVGFNHQLDCHPILCHEFLPTLRLRHRFVACRPLGRRIPSNHPFHRNSSMLVFSGCAENRIKKHEEKKENTPSKVFSSSSSSSSVSFHVTRFFVGWTLHPPRNIQHWPPDSCFKAHHRVGDQFTQSPPHELLLKRHYKNNRRTSMGRWEDSIKNQIGPYQWTPR